MRSTRIFTPGIYRQNDSVVLTPSGANHVARVLRARAGESIRVFDGADREFRARIVEIKNAKVSVRIEEPVLTVPESPLRIALIQGISRGERMDLVIQKAVELGVTSIHPVIAARSVVKLDKEQSAKKIEHWRGIAIGACEQCGRARIPTIASPLALIDGLSAIAPGECTRLVLSPTATQSLASLSIETNAFELLIGPEGGLDDEEISAAQRAGFIATTLGQRILRTETAAIAALAVLQARWGDLR